MSETLQVYDTAQFQQVFNSPQQRQMREAWATNEASEWPYPRRLHVVSDCIVALNRAQNLLNENSLERILHPNMPDEILPIWRKVFESGSVADARHLATTLSVIERGRHGRYETHFDGLIEPLRMLASREPMARPIVEAVREATSNRLPSNFDFPYGGMYATPFEQRLKAQCLALVDEQRAFLIDRIEKLGAASSTAVIRPAIEHPAGNMPEKLEFRVNFRGFFPSEEPYGKQLETLRAAFARHGLSFKRDYAYPHEEVDWKKDWHGYGYPHPWNTHPLLHSFPKGGQHGVISVPVPQTEIKFYSHNLVGPDGIRRLSTALEVLRETGFMMTPGTNLDLCFFHWKEKEHVTPDIITSVHSQSPQVQQKLAEAIFEHSAGSVRGLTGQQMLLQPAHQTFDMTRYEEYEHSSRLEFLDRRRREGLTSFHVAATFHGNLDRLRQHLPPESRPNAKDGKSVLVMGPATVNVLGYPELWSGNGGLFAGGTVSYSGYPASTSPNTVNFVSMLGEFIGAAAAGKAAQLPMPKGMEKNPTPAPAREAELLSPNSLKMLDAPEPAIAVSTAPEPHVERVQPAVTAAMPVVPRKTVEVELAPPAETKIHVLRPPLQPTVAKSTTEPVQAVETAPVFIEEKPSTAAARPSIASSDKTTSQPAQKQRWDPLTKSWIRR